MEDPPIQADVPLAPLTTLGVGGAARQFVRAGSVDVVAATLRHVARNDTPVEILGGGSNLVIADAGVEGLVLQIAISGIEVHSHPDGAVELDVGAGEVWDEVVDLAVASGWAGIECLSGIPGLVGATPIQNVGAYGQEVSDTLASVQAWDRRTGQVVELTAAECDLGYRTSRFRNHEPGRFLILRVRFRLSIDPPRGPRYAELARALPPGDDGLATTETIRQVVLDLRRRKGMLVEADNPDSRSAGSFFVNPVLDPPALEVFRKRASAEAPLFGLGDGRTKVAAAWLVEQAGFPRGSSLGRVAVSSQHALAIVNRGGAQAADVIALATRIRDAVFERFAIELRPEPIFLGFPGPPLPPVGPAR